MEDLYWWGLNLCTLGFSNLLSGILSEIDSVAAWRYGQEDWENLGLQPQTAERIVRNRARVPLDSQQQMALKNGAHFVGWGHPRYPDQLRQLSHPPPAISVVGDVETLHAPMVAVVGSRNASGYGKDVSYNFAATFASAGIGVVSGMARGIDAVAHRGCLDRGGPSVAVLGCGVDICYPPEEHPLRDMLARNGALVSEFPLGSSPRGFYFPYRNRIISALSQVVLVVEGHRQSGSLHTVDWALQLGREVFAVPGPIHSRNSELPHHLISTGASVAACAQDVLSRFARTAPIPTSAAPALSAGERILWESLDGRNATPDELAESCPVPLPGILSGLLSLEVKGLVRRMAGNRYARA